MDTLTVPTLDACDFGWYLSRMVAHGASDLFLSSDTPASLKVQGEIQPLNRVPLTGAHIEKMAYSMMGRYASSKHRSNPTWPWRSRSLGAFASTCITSRIPTMASLKLPPVMQSLAMLKRGLVPIEAPLARQIHLAGLDAGRPPPDGGTPYSDDRRPDGVEHVHKQSIIDQRAVEEAVGRPTPKPMWRYRSGCRYATATTSKAFAWKAEATSLARSIAHDLRRVLVRAAFCP